MPLSKQHSSPLFWWDPSSSSPRSPPGCQVHGQLSNCKFSMAAELFPLALGRGAGGPCCFQWAHFNTLVAQLCSAAGVPTAWCTCIFSLQISWKHRFQRLQEPHKALIHSHPGIFTEAKRQAFPGWTKRFDSGSEGLRVDWTSLRWEEKREGEGGRERTKRKGDREGRTVSRAGFISRKVCPFYWKYRMPCLFGGGKRCFHWDDIDSRWPVFCLGFF